MSRIKADIEIGAKKFWALFDGGARNTYVVGEVATLLPTFELETEEPVALGGQTHLVKKDCRLSCLVEGLPIRVNARVVSEIGTDEKGKRIEVLIGALAMEEWGIEANHKNGKLDMTYYSKEFVEF